MARPTVAQYDRDMPTKPAAAASNNSVKLLRFAGPVLILCAIVFAYHNAVGGPFVFDDESAVLANPSIRTMRPIWVPMFPPRTSITAGRPLVGVSYAINYAIGGFDPRGYHLFSIGLHMIAALLALAVLRRTLRRLGNPQADGIALAATLVWAVHPLLTDSVTYIAQRSELMMAVFFLFTLYGLLRSIDSPRPRAWLTAAVLSAIAASGCKENSAMILPIVLVFDVLILAGSWREALRRRWAFYLGLLVCSAMLPLQLAISSLQTKVILGNQSISSWRYLMMQSQIITRYLRLCVWPSPLVICYADWPIPNSVLDVWAWLVFVGALVIATTVGVIRKQPWSMLGAWVFLILAPTSSVLVIIAEPAGERRMYLPCLAVVLAIVLAGERLIRGLPQRERIGAAVVGVLVIALGLVTIFRNDDFSSNVAIWSDTIDKRPNNPRAHFGLGAELANEGDLTDAIAQFDRALALSPNYREPRVPRALAYAQLGQDDRALADLGVLQHEYPNDPEVMTGVASVLYHTGKKEEARAMWRQVLTINPADDEARRLLAESQQQASPQQAVPK